ncbi:MAG: MarR family transcriptional regulator [Candidatus Eisenbacteria bacterium]
MIEARQPLAEGNGDSHARHVLRITHVLSNAVREILEKRLIRETADAPLSLGQIHLLKLISMNGDHHVGEIASFLGVSAPAASKNIDKLARLDLLLRVIPERDRRNTCLRITPRGRNLVEEYETRRIETLKPILDTFTPEERQEFSRLLEKFVTALIQMETVDTRSCLRCGAFYEGECPVRGVIGHCPYERARRASTP